MSQIFGLIMDVSLNEALEKTNNVSAPSNDEYTVERKKAKGKLP